MPDGRGADAEHSVRASREGDGQEADPPPPRCIPSLRPYDLFTSCTLIWASVPECPLSGNLALMLPWMSSWEEAARRPCRVVVSAFLSGVVAGGLLGYFRFGDGLAYGIVLGVGFGLFLGTMTWRRVRDPGRVAVLTRRGRVGCRVALRRAAVRLALPFIALAIATAAGAATHSVNVFVITLALGLAAEVLLRFFLPR
jgi:hypothetical protein